MSHIVLSERIEIEGEPFADALMLIAGHERRLGKQMLAERAHLIAAAPKMVEALEGLLRWHRNEGDDTDEPPGEFLKAAYAALAKTRPS